MRFAFVLAIVVVMFAVDVSADRLVRLYQLDRGSVTRLIEDGYDVANVDIRRGFVDIVLPDDKVGNAALMTPRYEVLPREWSELLSENAKNAGYYYSPEENWKFWCTLAAEHDNLVDTPASIGKSYKDRDIYAIKMTSSSTGYKPTIFFTALIHAREPGSNVVLIDFANWLTDNYDGGDTRAAYILDNATLYFIPIANPDGYYHNMPGGGMHRKNMNFSDGDGVDLNRNWGYKWGYDDTGSSSDPDKETYRGDSAFSEPETQVQRDFTIDKKPVAALNYHTYGSKLLYPWGYDKILTPDSTLFKDWAAQMTAGNKYEYGTPWQVLYKVNGDQNDWCYSGQDVSKIYSMAPEVGDKGFWGSQKDSSEIERICGECRPMNIMLCMLVLKQVGIGEHGECIEPALAVSSVYPNPVNSSVVFTVTVPAGGVTDLTVYDTSGRMVHETEMNNPTGGEYDIRWMIPRELPAGVYSVVVTDGFGHRATSRFTVIR